MDVKRRQWQCAHCIVSILLGNDPPLIGNVVVNRLISNHAKTKIDT